MRNASISVYKDAKIVSRKSHASSGVFILCNMGLFQLHFVALCGLLLITSTTATLSPDSHGICYTYTIQGGDTCASIAEAHGITVADIETYNANTWAWYGCKGDWYQGSFICLSSGEPPMPAALPHATCGPQVPGATRLDSWSELTALNPCPSSECVSVIKEPPSSYE